MKTYQDIVKNARISNGGPGSGRRPGLRYGKTSKDDKGYRELMKAHADDLEKNPKATKSDKQLAAYLRTVAKIRNRRESSGITVEITGKILNSAFRTPADNWYHVAPKGEHPHPTKIVQVLDDKSINAMVQDFQNKKSTDPKFPGVLVDYDHVSQGGKTEAAGWIDNLQARNDGLWAHINWSDEGQKAINGGRYRLVSPVWKKSECEKLDGNKLRPMVLDSVGITNTPNMDGLVPLSL